MSEWHRDSEEFVADLFGFKLQPGSGNQIGKKGDLRGLKVLVENKATKGEHITFSAAVARKISAEAMLDGRLAFITYHAVGRGVWGLQPTDQIPHGLNFPVYQGMYNVQNKTRRVSVKGLLKNGVQSYVHFATLPDSLKYWTLNRIWTPQKESRYQ